MVILDKEEYIKQLFKLREAAERIMIAEIQSGNWSPKPEVIIRPDPLPEPKS